MPEDDTSLLRVTFDHAPILRILDEMPSDNEPEGTQNDGLIPDHFAYAVESDAFWLNQPDALKGLHRSYGTFASSQAELASISSQATTRYSSSCRP
jgi:hypothetical protein